MSDSCRDCHHWLPFALELERPEKDGVCRAHPPRLSSDVRNSASPTTAHDWWCGEWKALQPEGKG